MKKTALILLAGALVASPAIATVMSGSAYVAAAGASDLFERQSAQVVLESSTNPNIRSFASMMLSAHQQSTDMVVAAATRAHVPAGPPMLTPTQSEMIAELRAENGVARDATYVAQQRAAHGQALSLQKAYAASGSVAPLKMAAGKIVPVVQMHIAMLMKM